MGRGSSKAGRTSGGGIPSVVSKLSTGSTYQRGASGGSAPDSLGGFGRGTSVKVSRRYPDGTIEYESGGDGFRLPKSQEKNMIGAMDNVVKNQLAKSLGAKTSSIELNDDVATVWRDANRAERKDGALGAKDFYKIEAYTKKIDVEPDGRVSAADTTSFKFRYAGSKH